MDEKMVYNRSDMPQKPGAPQRQEIVSDPTRGDVSGPDERHLSYPSLNSEGRVELELPVFNPGSSAFKVVKFQSRDLGALVSKHVADALPIGNAHLLFAHYTGCCKGQTLLGPETQKRMNELSAAFARIEPGERQVTFYEEEIEPWLASLQPQAR